MIDSRNTDDLHPAVARGCRELIRRMAERGFVVGISSTYRDHAMQNYLYDQGRTRDGSIVTNARGGQSWHNWRVAFDIYQNIPGQAYSNAAFFATAGEIWESMGGEWGGSWKSFPDRPHFQMTFGKTLKQMQDGAVIPADAKMPWEETATTQDTPNNEDTTSPGVYRTISEMPSWAQRRIQNLVDMGVLTGRSEDNLDVDENLMRTLIIIHRMFDRANLLDVIAAN